MSKENVCPVHGENNASQTHNYSAKKAEALGHPELTVDPDCTCDVGETGPATTGGNVAVGPGLGGGNTPVGPGLGGGNTPAGPGNGGGNTPAGPAK